jgi:hypothetical protein
VELQLKVAEVLERKRNRVIFGEFEERAESGKEMLDSKAGRKKKSKNSERYFK